MSIWDKDIEPETVRQLCENALSAVVRLLPLLNDEYDHL